jgi:hypothetical protein
MIKALGTISRVWTSIALLTTVVLLTVCGPGPAFAEPAKNAAAKEYVGQAVSQYNLGHFTDAVVLFEKAYKLDPAPILLFNIGQCYRQLDNNERALFFYRRYLDQAPEASNHLEVEKRVADLERSVQEQATLKKKPPPGVVEQASASSEQPKDASAKKASSPEPEPTPRPVAPIVTTMPLQAPGAEQSSPQPTPKVYVSIGGGIELLSLSGRNVDVPPLGAVALFGAYILSIPTGFLDVGILATLTPLPYQTPGGSNAMSFLTGAFGAIRYRHPLTEALHLAGTLGGGVVWWSGLKEGDPFTAQRAGADGSIPMPSFRAALEIDFHITRGFYVLAGGGYTYSKTTSLGLTTSISSMSLFGLSAGAGYSF